MANNIFFENCAVYDCEKEQNALLRSHCNDGYENAPQG
jgi:hypothetical protein